MPCVGFGTAGLGPRTREAVASALEAGYTLLDSAQAREWYREDLVGAAVRDAGTPRHTLFLTSKVHPRHLGFDATAARVDVSLRELGTHYLDLMLLVRTRRMRWVDGRAVWRHATYPRSVLTPTRCA